MRFNNAADVESCVWDMRLSEQVRAGDREILLRLYDGFPPFSKATAEENNIQVNMNDLTGANVITQASRQWNNAHLKASNFFVATPDVGPAHKRSTWSKIATKAANSLLKRHPRMAGQNKATGKNTLLFGIGPTNWTTRRSIICKPVPVGSLLIPSETEIEDLDDSCSYFAIFREYNAEQLYDMTHGPHVDPGWNMELVQAQWEYIKEELRKSPNSIAYQYMPERIEQLEKQDKGYMGTDAAPTCDVWDFYFRQAENGKGWYRRIIVDWYVGDQMGSYSKNGTMASSRNRIGEKTGFLYTSGKRKYADSLGQIIHCNFGDCSAYAPVKYHSLRGLGWMLWGVCELQNRLHCKFNEAVFEQLMWFFQTAGNQDLIRLKKANFEHMGIIPQGIKFLTPQERYTPDYQLIQMAFARNRQMIADSSMSYTQDYEKSAGESARTATETMAIVNASQALASGIMESSIRQEAFKYREMFRRLCLKNSNDPMAREFRLRCLQGGIPEDMLDVEKWNIEPEQVVGIGNKTMQMATVGFLNQIRQNLPPSGQRLVDHISVEAATDQADLAEKIVPLGEEQPISTSMHDAQLASDRLLRGFEFRLPKEGIPEDYVTVWMHDLAILIQRAMEAGGMVDADKLTGMMNMAQHIGTLIDQMALNPNDKERVKQYQDVFAQETNHLKALAQRLQQSMKAAGPAGGNGAAEEQAKTQAKIEAQKIIAAAKAQNMRESHAERTKQKQISWEKQEQRKDLETQTDLQREGIKTRHELLANRLRALAE